MSAAPDFPTLYQFESALEKGFEDWLNNQAELKARGSAKPAEFQKDRPRVEAFVTIGTPVGSPPHFIVTAADGLRRENGWHATVHLGCITDTDAALQQAYAAAVREIMSRADQTLGDSGTDLLPYHEISSCFSNGSTRENDATKGYYLTHLTYDFIFAIRPEAWPGGLEQ